MKESKVIIRGITRTPEQIDKGKADNFADNLMDMLNKGALALMVSIGHRTGLFDTMSKIPHATSAEIAEVAGLNERYVREWLGAMVTGGIIECRPDGPTYYLREEHAISLKRQETPGNIGVFAQYISLLGSVEDQIVACFKNGGGVPYTDFKRFHEVMSEDSEQTVVSALLDHILPLVPDLQERLAAGINVLDIGCGRGRALNLMARNFPKSRFRGYDFSREAINYAQSSAAENGSDNVRFEVHDVTDLKEIEKYDLITAFDAIHDQAHPDRVLANVYQALKSDGIFLMQDISASSDHFKNIGHPAGPLLYTISCMHCMTVSLALNGKGLGAMWGRELAQQMLEEAGFGNVRISTLPHDFQNCYYIVRKN